MLKASALQVVLKCLGGCRDAGGADKPRGTALGRGWELRSWIWRFQTASLRSLVQEAWRRFHWDPPLLADSSNWAQGFSSWEDDGCRGSTLELCKRQILHSSPNFLSRTLRGWSTENRWQV